MIKLPQHFELAFFIMPKLPISCLADKHAFTLKGCLNLTSRKWDTEQEECAYFVGCHPLCLPASWNNWICEHLQSSKHTKSISAENKNRIEKAGDMMKTARNNHHWQKFDILSSSDGRDRNFNIICFVLRASFFFSVTCRAGVHTIQNTCREKRDCLQVFPQEMSILCR